MSEKSNQYKKFVLPVSLSVIFLVVGFILGTLHQKNHLRPSFANRNGQFQMNQNLGNRAGNHNQMDQLGGNITGQKGNNSGFVNGEITKIDDTSITLKTTDGGSKIILISADTTFNQSASATKDDLKIGSKILVTGATDSNTGSISGKTIQINPIVPLPPESGEPQQ